jgi:hypothetical protein
MQNVNNIKERIKRMPRQINNIIITDISGDPGKINIQMGDFSYEMMESELFDQQIDDSHLFENLRLAYLIGGYSQIDSVEFLTQIQKKGITLKSGIVHIKSIELIDSTSEKYMINYSRRKGQGDFSIEVNKVDFDYDILDIRLVIKNIGSSLIRDGHNKLTTANKNKIKNTSFWY